MSKARSTRRQYGPKVPIEVLLQNKLDRGEYLPHFEDEIKRLIETLKAEKAKQQELKMSPNGERSNTNG